MTRFTPPTPEEWQQAVEAAVTVDDQPITVRTTLVRNLLPGDGIAVRGRIHTVTGYPEGTHLVLVPVEGRTTPLEFTPTRQVPAWTARTAHYGKAYCPGCRTWGFHRDHSLEECKAVAEDTTAKRQEADA